MTLPSEYSPYSVNIGLVKLTHASAEMAVAGKRFLDNFSLRKKSYVGSDICKFTNCSGFAGR